MKKSNFNTLLSMALSWTFACAPLVAQTTVNTANTGPAGTFKIGLQAPCYFDFNDWGGPGANYNNGANATVTFLPSNPATHRIQIRFSSFGLEAGYDAFYIYNAEAADPARKILGPEGPTFSGFPGGNWQTISPGTVTANKGIAAIGANPAEALTFEFRADNAISTAGWTAQVSQIPIINCAMTAPNTQTVFTGAGSTSCFVNVTTYLPTFLPVGSNAGFQLQYRINGGTATVVNDPVTTTIPTPVGANVVMWELVDPCGGGVIASAIQLITVKDDTKPVINCPGSFTISLQPGACETNSYNYQVTCSDNCLFAQDGQVDHPVNFNNGQAGIMFDVTNLGANSLTITQFGPSLDIGTWPMKVYYTTNTGSFAGLENNPAAWTLAGTGNITSVNALIGTPMPGFGIAIPSGQTRGIYITSSTGIPLNYTDGVRQFADGNLRVSSNPGAGKAYPFGTSFPNKSYNGFVKYSTLGNNVAEQISGVPSGEIYRVEDSPIVNIFKCTDASGNTSTCSFTVTVVDYPNAISGLVCNDLVQVALGPDCITTINADQVLEGGPYKCYGIYVVELDKIPPYGNGPWVPAVLDRIDVGKTYRVRVTDPETSNRCTGDIKVVDNLAPPIACTPSSITLPCNFPLDPLFSNLVKMTLRFNTQNLPINVGDFQTKEFDIPVNLSLNAIVNDVDVRVKISGDVFNNNLRIQAVSPSGTVVTLSDQVTGGAPAPLFVQFDDEGSQLLTTQNYTTDQCATIPYGVGLLSSFDNENANGSWKIRVSDLNGFLDVSTVEKVELVMTMTGVFGAGFPNGLTAQQVTENGFQSYLVPAGLLDPCSNVTLTYTDQMTPQDCGTGLSAIIQRRWSAKDASGNASTSIQQIEQMRPTLRDVSLPPNYDGIDAPQVVFDCNDTYPTANWIESKGLQGYPYVFNQRDGCNTLHAEYEDKAVQTCDGSYTINREWSIIDHCTGKFTQHIQIIRIIDQTGPSFIGSQADIVETTDPYDCCSRIELPDILVKDGCSRVSNIQALIITKDPYTGLTTSIVPVMGGLFNFPGNPTNNPDTLGSFELTPCIPVGVHTVRYIAQDACGNTSTLEFKLTVIDHSPPVASCDETTVVAIGKDDPNDCYYANVANGEFAGVTCVHAATFDDGSYDECSSIKFSIRRAWPYSDCINALDHSPCNANAGGLSEYGLATVESDSITFYSCEVGTALKVIVRVYQLCADGTISLNTDGDPIYNEAEVVVQVQDKLKPICDAPFNVTVNCENFDPTLWTYGKPNVYDNSCLDASYNYQGQKGLAHSVNYNNFDTVCNKGTIVRTFKVYDCHGNTAQCTQRIVVNYEQNYFVKFPDDAIVNTCDGTGMFGEPQFYGEDCELLGVSFVDQIFTIVPDACYKIERTWTIINWCTYNPNLPCVEVPNPNPHTNTNHVSNLPGPTVSAAGTASPWAPTVVKINPGDPSATNYSQFWTQNANCYKYKQIIKIIDTQPPIMICPPSPEEFCDLTNNDPQLWNESYWWDLQSQSHDLGETPVDLSVSATDFCSGSNLSIRYLLFLDTDGNGSMETVVSSTNPPAAGTVNYDNLNTPNFSGGTPRQFDKRSVAANQKYRFAMQTTLNGTSLGASVRWNTPASPATYVVPEFPYGTHKIKWIVSDGCGNESVCEYMFTVKDCKTPSIVCLNGMSANMMPTGAITLYASDFLLHASDNCTPADDLLFAIRKCSNGTAGFPVDGNGNPAISLNFDCTEVGTQCVQLWAQDAYGNADYCETYIIVQDNAGNCGAGSATVAGLLKTEMSDGLEETDVELAGPTFNLFDVTDQSGQYSFSNAVPMHADYTITPTKDDNPLNGVTTYDLVLISKHILGVEPFTTPYKMIAADANKSGSITTFDIVELRKLILGLYTDLPSNDSWRFVDKSFQFPNDANPFQTAFPETKTVADIQANAIEDNFVAIKVGDVNASAIANSLMSVEERTSASMLFDVEDRTVKAGEVFEVKFKAAEKVAGYQFTLNYNDLDLADIVPGPGMKADNFATFASDNALTTSFDGTQQAEFTLKFKATKAGELNKMIRVSSRITKAEGYQINPSADPSANRLDIALRFNNKDGSTITGVGFELYQNQPNPFVNRTLVGFHLPDAATATLSVFDQSGRLVFRQKGDFPKGYNTISLEKGLLNTSGTLFYTLETATDSATKTMIQVK
ncbi:MAG: proprotein convertase P-domain-containing protein [Phycisphaerae bacterium]|nr:proprotein convertase P-domain-containing protein [Saprospiraceae bacterium]